MLADEHTDVLREGLGWLVGELMENEIAVQAGAALHEKSPQPLARRNGYRERLWQTRLGALEPAIPRPRAGTYFPSFLEPRTRSEQALVAVVQEAYVNGVSTRNEQALVAVVQEAYVNGVSTRKVERLVELELECASKPSWSPTRCRERLP